MTFSLTTRFRLPFWSTKNDVPTRAEFNAAFASLESLAALIKVGIDSDRDPTGGTPNQLYYATDTGKLWYNGNGSYWAIIGDSVGFQSAYTVTLTDPATGSVLGTFAPGGVKIPALQQFTAASGVSGTGGTASTPGYTKTTDGLVVCQGMVFANGASSVSITLPQPRDKRDHYWFLPTGGFNAAQALLQGSGQLQIQGIQGNIVSLDPVIYQGVY